MTTTQGPIRKALRMSLLNTVVGKLGTFVTGIVLARLLMPHDFGVYAVAFVALIALLSLNELGVSLAIVRWPGDPERIRPTVTTISVVTSIFVYLLCWFGAPAFTAAMEVPEATGVVRVLCVGALIDGLSAPVAQLMNREFRQGLRLFVDLSNLIVTTGLTVTLAATGHGAWSLAWGQIAGNAVSSMVLFALSRKWPRLGFDRKLARELIMFGLPLAGASLLMVAMWNIDKVISGRILGVFALGLYLQAFNLASWPVNVFSLIVRRVSLAAFARVQDDPAKRQETFAKMAMVLAIPTLPVCTVLGLLALPVVTTLYGSAWSGSAVALQFLALLGVVRVASELAYDFLVALGRSRATLWLQAGWLVALLVFLPLGALFGGIEGVGIAHAGVALFLVLPAYAMAVARTGISMRALAAPLARPLLGTLCMVAVILVVRWFTEPSFLQLLMGGALGLLAYLPAVWPLRKTLGALK
ncbi:PST family polysaccharide transporter [Kibdelosporangium banguiense]|uniref:PST family polysaccharide transporter n=1 Tax=Kibdelosporangium banguiense TaxID=1365924 RepID=A0ABS4TCT8_9PSEU|nr:lipopolysaccharide biosynthesis protein [Kibdelosporangium banguiense]MBP2322246.1 PST family polysaccharide transporter [Kibdelosporangium banguiense]